MGINIISTPRKSGTASSAKHPVRKARAASRPAKK
jgi:hypothetical protein